MALSIPQQSPITPGTFNQGEAYNENVRRANAADETLRAAVDGIVTDGSVRSLKLGADVLTPDPDGQVVLPSGVVAPAMTTAQRDALTPAQRPLGALVYNTSVGALQMYRSTGWGEVTSPPVIVNTSVALAAFTAAGDATYTVPLGATFRSAMVLLASASSSERPGSLMHVTTDPQATISSSRIRAADNATSPAFGAKAFGNTLGVLRVANEFTDETITTCYLAGTSLVIGVTRTYFVDSNRPAPTAFNLPILIHGRP